MAEESHSDDLPTQSLAGEVAMIYHTTGNMANIHDNARTLISNSLPSCPYKKWARQQEAVTSISSTFPEDRVQAAWKFIKFATTDSGMESIRLCGYKTVML